MGPIARLTIFAAAAVLTLLGFFLPEFQLVPDGTMRLAGGLAMLASAVACVLVAAIVASCVQVVRGHRSPAIAAWTSVSAVGLALVVLGVVITFRARSGTWTSLAACGLALIAHTRLPQPRPQPQPIAAPPRKPTTIVRAAEVGHAGLRVTTDAGSTSFAWEELLRVQLITGLEPGVEITTRGAILRINRKTTADYRFLPGATDGTAADNLRRLYEYAREKNPGLRLTP
ncbi:MAG TPA: hypothetical protein VM261_32605 [Kofleriaceae bacterium]|nr:hypothetical protein [Kofleriaceae bacterium]